MRGRPSKFTPVIREAILAALHLGNTRTCAAEAAGIDHGTLSTWCTRYPEFLTQIKKAEAEAQQRAVKVITDAAPTSWQAAAWMLERRHPNEWGKVDRVEVTIREHAEKLANELGVSVEDVIREAEMIAAGRG